jgi:N-acetylmuramoyl-L-alanine amidase
MKSAQRYMILFLIAAVIVALVLLPVMSGARLAMQTPKGTIVIAAGHGGFDGGAVGR